MYFNILHQVLGHCDDVHSLFSLFALHVDYNSQSAETRHYYYMLKQKYFDSPQRLPLPKGGSDADAVVAEQLMALAIGEPTDFLVIADAIAGAKHARLLNRRLQPVATAHLSRLFNVTAGSITSGASPSAARKTGIVQVSPISDEASVRAITAFFMRFSPPWVDALDAVV